MCSKNGQRRTDASEDADGGENNGVEPVPKKFYIDHWYAVCGIICCCNAYAQYESNVSCRIPGRPFPWNVSIYVIDSNWEEMFYLNAGLWNDH